MKAVQHVLSARSAVRILRQRAGVLARARRPWLAEQLTGRPDERLRASVHCSSDEPVLMACVAGVACVACAWVCVMT